MLNHKPPKIEVRNFKNALISSRNDSKVPQSASNQILLKTAFFFNEQLSRQSKTNSQYRPQSKRANQGSSSQKRLKLKDYIHLNGLQKKSKSKSNVSNKSLNHKLDQDISFDGSRSSQDKTNIFESRGKNITKSASSNKPDINHSSMIRSEILAKIETQRKKLNDLQSYITSEFEVSSDMTQTFVFLFNIFNKLSDIHEINGQIGANIKQYEKKSIESGKNIKSEKQYHWDQQPKELDSPAKIMSIALCKTFDLAQLLNIPK